MSSDSIVQFYYAPGSRYSYLAASQIDGLEADTGCRVEWRAVDGREIRALRGRDPFRGEPLSGQYDWEYRRVDAENWADHYGIPFREPRTHGFDHRLLVRAAAAAKRLGAVAAYSRLLFAAVYGSATWPLDEGLCRRVAEQAGLAAEDFARTLSDPETERLLQETAREACARGAFGVPTFFLGERMFWGNDRIVLLRHALRRERGGVI